MSENVTLETIVDDDGDIFDEAFHNSEQMARIIRTFLRNFEVYYTALIIVIGIPLNILALLLLVRRRLWLQHEAYVYVAAILIINILELVIRHSNQLLEHMNYRFLRFPTTADIACKVWHLALFMIFCRNWLHVLMLLNVYLRQQLITYSDRKGFFMNFADKYCSLLGTKVVVVSFFAFWAVAFFWNFSISTLQAFHEFWFCTLNINVRQHDLLENSTVWFGINLPFVVLILLIVLIAWKKKRSSRIVFNQMDGVILRNGDAETMVLCCAAVFFVLRAPRYIVFVIYTFDPEYVYNGQFRVAFDAVTLISFSSPLSTPIVCYTVKSRFRDAFRTMMEECCRRQCCPGTRSQRNCSQKAEDNRSSVLQMDPIEVDLNNTENEESLD